MMSSLNRHKQRNSFSNQFRNVRFPLIGKFLEGAATYSATSFCLAHEFRNQYADTNYGPAIFAL